MDVLEQPVNLVIKAPNQKIDDQIIECKLDWTVKKLKAYLSEAYPSKPKSEEQKLIYSGQLLHDHLMLKDFLRQYDTNSTHTIHLVCAPNRDSSFWMNPPANGPTVTPSSSTTQTNVPREAAASSADNVRHRSTNATASTSQPQVPPRYPVQPLQNFPYSVPVMPGTPMTPESIAQQMYWMQQMYVQYMSQYMQYLQGNAVYVNPNAEVILPSAPAAPQPVVNQNVPERPANENIRMNAQGGPVDDNDDDEFGPNRDWLDWFYILSRVTVLFSIVYFYSSMGRFLAVTLLATLFYFYQAGWLRLRRSVNRPHVEQENIAEQPQPQPPTPPPAQPPPEVEISQNDSQAAESAEEQMRRETQEMENMMDNDVTTPVPEPSPSIITISWTFITTFFSSLIPEQPAPAN